MTREEAKMKNFDVLHFVADNAGLSTFEAIEKAYNMGVSEQKAVLDKIRAEIEAKCCITVGRENDGAITLHDVFEIINKYKAEVEPQKSEDKG